MKIRTGFVSNSSSSSFCIYGIHQSTDVLAKKLKITGDEHYFYEDIKNVLQKMIDDNHLNDDGFIIAWDYGNDKFYFGRTFKSIHDNETGKQFKKSTQNIMNKLLKDFKCMIIDAYVSD